jgi:hypothetical protein
MDVVTYNKNWESSLTYKNWESSIQYHCSSVRFIRAGLYLDAIHSIIQSLEVLQVKLTLSDIPDTQLISDKEGMDSCHHILSRSPMDPTQYEMRSSADLPIALIYNLALAFHLFAIAEINDEIHNFNSILQESLRLYNEAERRILSDNANSVAATTLQNNVRHLHAVIKA